MLRLHILRLAVVITFVFSFNLDLAIGQSVLSHATGTIEDDSSHQLHWLFLPMVTRNSATIVGQISFLSESPSSSLGNSLYLINANGSNLYQIIDTVCSIHEYHWSSGGERILLTTNVGSCMDETTSEIFVVNADGTNLVRLTDNSLEEGQTKFSPDGNYISFIAWDRIRSISDLYVMKSDGSERINLTDNAEHDSSTSWSPDGMRIAFASFINNSWDIFLLNPDGTDLVQLTTESSQDFSPIWSPDGSHIEYQSVIGANEDWEVFTMNSDGTNKTNLTNNPGSDTVGQWSPDGMQIVFQTERDGTREIYIMNSDGSQPRNLTQHTAFDLDYSLSPDGKYVVFASQRCTLGTCIYIVDVDGLSLTPLPFDHQSKQPAWRPNGGGKR